MNKVSGLASSNSKFSLFGNCLVVTVLFLVALWAMSIYWERIVTYASLNGVSAFWQSPFTTEEFELLEPLPVMFFVLYIGVYFMFLHRFTWATRLIYVFFSLAIALIAYGNLSGLTSESTSRNPFIDDMSVLISAFNLIGLPLIFIYRKFIRKPDSSI